MFVPRLLQALVPEVAEDRIEIVQVERSPGDRCRVRLRSKQDSLDAVGACVGLRAARLQALMRELRGERVEFTT